jgi:hypothetical protein
LDTYNDVVAPLFPRRRKIDARATRFRIERRRWINDDDDDAILVHVFPGDEVLFHERVFHEKRENGRSRVERIVGEK